MKVSVVCPFYNEEAIIEQAAVRMLANLARLDCEWEFIAVNDGSTDGGPDLVKPILSRDARAKFISYPHNEGRGYALQTGIRSATGDIIVTTEMDLSWGDTIVSDILAGFEQQPHLDVVVASPNLPGGGYRNVPFSRVLVSRIGNNILRLLFTKRVTMNTGMTRGYRRKVIQRIRTDEKGKEFHLEVLLKLVNLGYRIGEIPAILEWRADKLAKDARRGRRRSSSKTLPLIFSHLNFAIFANPIRYFGFLSLICFVAALLLLAYGACRLVQGEKAIFFGTTGLFLCAFSLMFLGFGVLAAQNSKILTELWRRGDNGSD